MTDQPYRPDLPWPADGCSFCGQSVPSIAYTSHLDAVHHGRGLFPNELTGVAMGDDCASCGANLAGQRIGFCWDCREADPDIENRAIVAYHTWLTDPMQLRSMGAPDDEYEPEAPELLAALRAAADVEDLAQRARDIFVRWFSVAEAAPLTTHVQTAIGSAPVPAGDETGERVAGPIEGYRVLAAELWAQREKLTPPIG